MARKTRGEALATREDILDAALDCFHEHGIVSTTLAMIATRAGYTRGAVYWHFKNKTEVLEAMINRERTPFVERLARMSSPRRDTPIQDLRATLLVCIAELADDSRMRELMEIMLRYDLSDDGRSISEMQRRNEYEEMDMVRATLIRARELGQLRDGTDIEVIGRMVSLTLNGVLYSSMISPHTYDILRDGMEALDLVLSAYAKPGLFVPGTPALPEDIAGWEI